MKQGIHPTYYPSATITCACGASYTVGATVETIHVEICAACHPFYTGKQKLIDTARRVEKFQERSEKAKVKQAAIRAITDQKKERAKKRKQNEEQAVRATAEAETAAKQTNKGQ